VNYTSEQYEGTVRTQKQNQTLQHNH